MYEITIFNKKGFTLLELAIVLIIIGLLAGAVFVGRDLISSSQVRAQLAQIDKYNSAVASFQSKFNCLPGDCAKGATYGFVARGSGIGQGDGDGILQGAICGGGGSCAMPGIQAAGETAVFWMDLSAAGLIDGSYTAASETVLPSGTISGINIAKYVPAARMGNGNYVYVYGGALASDISSNAFAYAVNYFGVAAITQLYSTSSAQAISSKTITVQQAFNIDSKIDDGYPQTGNVIAAYINNSAFTSFVGATGTAATTGSATTCYDNGGVAGTQLYSTGQNKGAGPNCALSFQFGE